MRVVLDLKKQSKEAGAFDRKAKIRNNLRWPLFAIMALLLVGGCDTNDWESAGSQDGYASTINTTCKFRSTLIHGKWDNAAYTKGYSRGANAGASAVAAQGCEKLR